MDGLEVCRAIKQAPATRDIPVVLLVTADDELLRQRAEEAGADDIAVKPVGQVMLLTLVRAQVRIKDLKRQLDELEGIVVTLARGVEDRDHSSAGHSEKVAHWAMQLGSTIGLADDQLTYLYKAALLHDVGSLSVPVGVLAKQGRLELNAGRRTLKLTAVNTGDRPIQIGSHFHFFEVNKALEFDRSAAFNMRLDIPAGTAVRFEPGASKEVSLVEFGGSGELTGLNNLTGGLASDPRVREAALARAKARDFRGA